MRAAISVPPLPLRDTSRVHSSDHYYPFARASVMAVTTRTFDMSRDSTQHAALRKSDVSTRHLRPDTQDLRPATHLCYHRYDVMHFEEDDEIPFISGTGEAF